MPTKRNRKAPPVRPPKKTVKEVRERQLHLDTLGKLIRQAQRDNDPQLPTLLQALPKEDLEDLQTNYFYRLRPEQQLPTDKDWHTLIVLAGRSSGKTEMLSSTIVRLCNLFKANIVVIAADIDDGIAVNVYGESGILQVASSYNRPHITRKSFVEFQNGSIVEIVSGVYPKRIRGRSCHAVFIDELVKHRIPEETLTEALAINREPSEFGNRQIIASTPCPMPYMIELEAKVRNDPKHYRRAQLTPFQNAENLGPTYMAKLAELDPGSAFYRQEVLGEIVESEDGVFYDADLRHAYTGASESLAYLVEPFDQSKLLTTIVSIDPSGGKKRGDECGIVVVGTDGQKLYVLEDASGRMDPAVWSERALKLVKKYHANYILIESNFAMGDSIIRQLDPDQNIKRIRTNHNKRLRSMPVKQLFELGKIRFVGDKPRFRLLHNQLITFTGIGSHEKDDRADALFLACEDLGIYVREKGSAVDSRINASLISRSGTSSSGTQAKRKTWSNRRGHQFKMRRR